MLRSITGKVALSASCVVEFEMWPGGGGDLRTVRSSMAFSNLYVDKGTCFRFLLSSSNMKLKLSLGTKNNSAHQRRINTNPVSKSIKEIVEDEKTKGQRAHVCSFGPLSYVGTLQ